jgi:iron complex transport system permease protein
MVLAGMVVLSFFNALLMILKYFSDPYDELPSIVFWIMGSLTRVTWSDLYITAPVTCCGLGLFMLLRFRLNILSLGDVQAQSLGMNPAVFRLMLILASSFMVALTVATCGQICWIGLIIPHMARTLVGPEHENMIPVTALLGAIFMLAADGLARSVTAAEIPVGIITALTGAPIFAFLLYKNRGSGWL